MPTVGRVARADTARLTPTPVCVAQFSNDDTKLPDWLAIAIRPAGGLGATICAHSRAGVDTTPWPLGPATRMPSSSASATSSCLGPAALLAGLAVARAR